MLFDDTNNRSDRQKDLAESIFGLAETTIGLNLLTLPHDSGNPRREYGRPAAERLPGTCPWGLAGITLASRPPDFYKMGLVNGDLTVQYDGELLELNQT
ncbi:hypothetical protein [Mucilaginibacter segetis]|uniref:Uncharacterized protein n=1 Tax=Mucilaginibacter segetis TaxID=2793071 RepID=A0A934PUY5_9SPHI|nr:hypothetical protein [Mucilaginibacter segetis]MBK0381319.1 hypothetical protein [Mucilaginibacter segetis]